MIPCKKDKVIGAAAVLVSGLILLSFGSSTEAGNWGDTWGRMYWGSNPTSVPNAPVIASAVADSESITITMESFPTGTGADGWSAVYEYVVTCGDLPSETFTDSIVIDGLDPSENYSCAVTARNEVGDGEATVQVVTTDALNGLNIILLCAAIDCSA